MATGPQRLIPLVLSLDTTGFNRKVDETAERTRKKLGVPLSGGGSAPSAPGPSAEDRRAATAAESLQRQRSNALIAEEKRINAAVESLQRQRSAALIAEERQTAAAAESLQRQRSAALARQWQDEQQAVKRLEAEKRREYEATANHARSVMQAAAVAILATIALVTAAVIAASTKAAIIVDSLKRGLTAVAGSRTEAERQFKELREVAKLPGLNVQEAVLGGVKLQAAGADFTLTVNTLKSFGNALATVGKGGRELGAVNEQIAQILSKNKILAQDIRIIADYVPQLRKAMLAAFGTADTEALQARGVTAVEFLNKVNAELAKLPQVSGGAQNALENFQDALFLAAAAFGEKFLPYLTKFLELVTPLVNGLAEMQGAALLVGVAVSALAVAMLAFNTNAVVATIAAARQLVTTFQAVYVSMRLVAAGMATTATSLVVGTAGWFALVAALGAVAYGIYSALAAQKEIIAATDEQVKSTAESLRQRQSELDMLVALGDGTRATADEQKRAADIYEALDVRGRARVDALAEETSRTEALAAETRRLTEAERERLRFQGATVAANFANELEKYNELLAERARLESTVKAAEQRKLRNDLPPVELDVAAGQQRIVQLSAVRLREVIQEIETQETAVRNLAHSLVTYRNTTEQSIEGAFELARTLGLSEKATASLVSEVERLSKEQKSAAGEVDALTTALQFQQKVAATLAAELDNASKARRKLIEEQRTIIEAGAKSGEEARRMLAEARGNKSVGTYINGVFVTLDDAIRAEQAAKRARKALDEVIDPSKVHRQKDAVEKLSDRLKQLRADIASFSDLNSPSFETRFKSEDLERVKRAYERILDLRRVLNLPLDEALPKPSDLAGIEQMQEHLESLARVKEGVRSVTDDARKAQEEYAVAVATKSVPAVNAGTLAETKYLKVVRERAQAEHDLVSDLVVAQRQRADAERDATRRTAMAYGELKLGLLKDLDELDKKIAENAVLAAVLGGDEARFERELVGRVKIETPKPPSELEVIASEAVKQSGYLSSIEALLSGKSGGATQAGAQGFNAAAFLPELKQQLRALGLGEGVLSAVGQSGTHNARHLDHRNGIDVAVNPQSSAGRALVAWLEAKGVPNIPITAQMAREGYGTGAHVHVGPRSHGGGPYRVGSMLSGSGTDAAPPTASWWDKSVSAVKEWGPKVGMALLLALGTPPPPDVKVTSSALGGKSVYDLIREKSAKKGQLDVGEARTNALQEIAANEGRLHNQLIDFETDLKLTRSRNALEREREDRATALSIKVAEEDIYKLRAGNEEAVGRVRAKAAEQRVQQQVSVAEQIIALEEEMAHASEGSADRYKLAWLEAQREVQHADEEAVESQIKSQVKLANATILSSEQVRARVLDHLASQKSASEEMADAIVGAYDAVAGAVQAGVSRLTGGVRILDQLLASVINRLISRVFQRFLDALFPSSGGASSSGGGGGGTFSFTGGGGGSGGASLTSSLTRAITGGGSGSGSPFSGNLFSLLTGGSRSGVVGAPPVPGSGLAGTSTLFAGLSPGLRRDLSLMALDDPGLLSGGAGGLSSIFGSGGIGGFARGPLAQMLPLLGVGLGAGLGGQSGGGRILGGIGGGLGGLLGMGLLQGGGLGGLLGGQVGNLMGFLGLGGALGAATLGVGAAVALIGAVIMGRNKQRQEDEKKRNTYADSLGTAVWQMITDIKAGADASSALAQLPALEQQYLQQANAIKDSKTRRHALLWFNNPPETGDYQAAKKILMQVANESLEAKARAQNQVPEYANGLDGGLVGQHLIKVKPGERFLPPEAVAELMRNGGLVPGAASSTDNTYMYAPTGSAVLNEDQQRAMQTTGVGVRMLPLPESAALPRPVGNDGAAAAPVAPDFSGLQFHVHVYEGDKPDMKEVVLEVMDSRDGGRIIAKHRQNAQVHGRRG